MTTSQLNGTGLSPARKWGTLAVACLAMLLLAIDLTVLHLAVPRLVEALNPTATQVLWIVDSYGFALAGLLVTMGGLGDRIGRKRLLLIGAAAFGAASALTAYAVNPALLIAARALLGVAGATIMPSTLSLIRNVFTDPGERTAAIGAWSGIGIVGYGLGPLVGGALLGRFWWGSVFLLNVPVAVVILVLGALVLPESRNPAPGRLDLAGVALSVAGIVGVVYAIKEGAYHGIGRPDVVAAAVVGIVALVAFARRQSRSADPLIDVRLFRRRAFTATVTITLVAMFAQLAVSLVMTQYLQLVGGWSPLRAGIAGLPGMGGAVVGAVLSGPVITRLGRAATVAVGLALSGAGLALYAQAGPAIDYPFLLLSMIVFGLGLALTLTVTTDTVLASVPKERAGAGSAISETASELGGALGIAVLGSLLGAVYRARLRLPAGLPGDATGSIRDSLGSAVAVAAHLPGAAGPAVLDAARAAYVAGMRVTLYTSAGVVVLLAAVALITLRGVPKVIADDQPAAEVALPVD